MLFQFLLVIHVFGAMLWFGSSLSMPRRARTALQAEITSARAQLQGLGRDGRLLGTAGLVTFLTGVSLVFARGGFAGLPVRFHVSLVLAFIWLVVGLWFGQRTMRALVASSAGERIAPEAEGLARRLGMIIGIQHALFSTITVLMLWRLG